MREETAIPKPLCTVRDCMTRGEECIIKRKYRCIALKKKMYVLQAEAYALM